ncbi:hypothetical protein DFS34DRAFT_633826 [Phlyctochytrium arcticum]|nr:hypothetical protein DFS34DRAFT_633826 [Phlyctochytrium arcticum]
MSAQIRANALRAEDSSIWPLRQRLFNPGQPFTLRLHDFNEQWKLGDNFWNVYGTNKRADGVLTTSYKCKLKKHRKSSGPRADKEGEPSKKRRITSVFNSVDCAARLLVIKNPANGTVTIQMHPDYSTHSAGHHISDVDDVTLCSQANEFIQKEANQPYAPCQIADALPEIIARSTSPCRAAALGLSRITARAVWNKRWKARKVAAAPPSSLDEDVSQAILDLQGAGYEVKRFLIASDEGNVPEGFAFATARGLETLVSSSYLVQLDSTHKTNIYDWRLFTVMVRDKHDSWIPAGQFYTSVENACAVNGGLQTLRDMVSAGGFGTWQPRYFLIDQSHVEKNGIHKTFRGMEAGEEEVYVKFCKVM